MQKYQEQYAKQSEEILGLFLDMAEEGEQPKIMSRLKKTLKKAQKNVHIVDDNKLDRMEMESMSGEQRLQVWQQQNDMHKTIMEIQGLSSDSDDEEEFVYNGSKFNLINMIVLLLTIVLISQYP
ncbi:unnamed protein product (macronuclear) [Paramecium tetraurelia]|uniref:Uncharacterized protein n=1 Tax=Paramecium tetraurelia TaxID=5888 RepID=A0E8M9_PARTE|nr:uncharacterized protein GSPATT00024375001 [Paramecium tetraurelia]CAK91646.1 unnamed protein product [Paramecium tetraurelia]|eukprot:XP_001459043.1 hypothetical protein (macronuclear) [Paramecium tetraurelia strain d4-2]